MRSIFIGFSYPKKCKIGAEAIKWWTSSSYSHTYIRFEGKGEIPSSVYHAANGSVHFMDFERFKEKNWVHKEYKIDLEDDVRNKILADCIRLASTKYGYTELVKIFYVDLHYMLGLGIPDTWNSPGYICSELVGKVMVKHLDFKLDKPLYLMKPNEIDQALSVRAFDMWDQGADNYLEVDFWNNEPILRSGASYEA